MSNRQRTYSLSFFPVLFAPPRAANYPAPRNCECSFSTLPKSAYLKRCAQLSPERSPARKCERDAACKHDANTQIRKWLGKSTSAASTKNYSNLDGESIFRCQFHSWPIAAPQSAEIICFCWGFFCTLGRRENWNQSALYISKYFIMTMLFAVGIVSGRFSSSEWRHWPIASQ